MFPTFFVLIYSRSPDPNHGIRGQWNQLVGRERRQDLQRIPNGTRLDCCCSAETAWVNAWAQRTPPRGELIMYILHLTFTSMIMCGLVNDDLTPLWTTLSIVLPWMSIRLPGSWTDSPLEPLSQRSQVALAETHSKRPRMTFPQAKTLSPKLQK